MTGLTLDHLWQSTMFAALVGLLALMLRGNSARIRYYLWFAASVKFLIPLAALTAAGSYLLTSLMPPVSAPGLFLLKPMAQPFSTEALTFSGAPAPEWNLTRVFMPLALVFWGVGCAAILGRWLMRWFHVQRILGHAVDCPIAAPVPVKMAPSMLEPGLVGIWRPMVLLPQGINERLSQAEMDAILAHEICHLRRRDNLLAATHMLVEALFWFHPLVWWVGARLNAEREHACDESVLADGQTAQVYAESILKVCQFYLHSPLDCASGISGADLKRRIESIMRNGVATRLNLPKKALLAASAAAMLALPLYLGFPIAIPMAMAQSTTPSPGSEAALRRQIDAWERREPLLSEMTPAMAKTYTAEREQSQRMIDDWGALKSITFRQKDGTRDVYMVEFAKGYSAWTIDIKDGKVDFLLFLPAIQRQDSGPSPGAEDALRRLIQNVAQGRVASDLLTPAAAQSAQQQLPVLNGEDFKSLGALRSLTFTEINSRGWDVFSAKHEHGNTTWAIAPLKNGRVDSFALTDISLIDVQPRPGTAESIRRYIEALRHGQPDYGEMTSAMAEAVRRQLPDILDTIRPLGAVRSITFKGRGLRDMDTYNVVFEHGTAEFRIGPLTADGKVERRGFTILNE